MKSSAPRGREWWIARDSSRGPGVPPPTRRGHSLPTSPRTARLGRARVNVTRRGVAR